MAIGLEIDVTSDVGGAVSGLEDVARAAGSAAEASDDLGRQSEDTSRRIGISADAADNLASTSSQATGALGALGSGFELVGLGAYSEALGQASMATDFLSGVGDSLTLVMESQAVKTAAARAASIASTVATSAQTAAQTALNVAMRANPIGLVVLAATALVGGFVLLYNKVGPVRDIIDKVGSVGKEALGFVLDKAGDVANFFNDKLAGAFRTIRTTFNNFGDKVIEVGKAILKPFQDLYNKVEDIIDRIKDIKLPFGVGDLGGSVEDKIDDMIAANGSGRVVARAAAGGAATQVTFVIQGAVDQYGTAEQINRMLAQHARLFVNPTVSFVTTP